MRSFPRSSPNRAQARRHTGPGAGMRRAHSVGSIGPATPQPRRRGSSSCTPQGKGSSPAKSTPPAKKWLHAENSRSPSDLPSGFPETNALSRAPLQDFEQAWSAGYHSQGRPGWDSTNSDMSRYKLNHAEQLRRHLLRMSKHHDEAAAQVQRKLRQMQENIAPFLPETEHFDSTSSVGASPAHMTPCFASRVPTGRLPEKGTAPSWRQCSKLAARDRQEVAVPREAHESQRSHRGSELMRVEPREEHDTDVEAEIDEFLHRQEAPVEPAGRAGYPQYRFLRRVASSASSPASQVAALHATASSQAVASPPRDLQPVNLFAGKSVAREELSCDSDSELGEIEDQAGQLEAQLAWWSRQRDILGCQSASAGPAPLHGAPVEDSAQELCGCSEWLQLPHASKSSDSNAAETVEDPEAQQVLPLQVPDVRRTGKLDLAEDRVEDTLTTLPEIIAKQAAELVASALQEAALPAAPEELLEESEVSLPAAADVLQVEESMEESPPVPSQRSKALALAEAWAAELRGSADPKAAVVQDAEVVLGACDKREGSAVFAASAAPAANVASAGSSASAAPAVSEPEEVLQELRREKARRHITDADLERRGDLDRNDLLTPGELQELLRSVGVKAQPDLALQVFEDLDVDSSGRISFKELQQAFLPKLPTFDARAPDPVEAPRCVDISHGSSGADCTAAGKAVAAWGKAEVSSFTELFNI
eukprot:TRINITY_DN110414_c0_g1_i1.p1 TRINITY_DN110414_c0_g1~~TRINITY_DN110414_c0_g1_i1.p1  ORF type:complete len:708 (-),score=173.58 TRINITY_DN110414_c0_g1_i1:74-2197(-)